MPFHMV